MGPADFATILVSLIAAVVAVATNRSSNKASSVNVSTSGRVEMEKEAYERARKLDTDTIERQDREVHEALDKNDKLEARLETVQTQNIKLNEDVARISKDNYQLHRENVRVLELNEQMLAENKRLREQGDRIIKDNARLSEEVGVLRLRVTKLQRGIHPDSTERIRERETDTSPMMPEVVNGRE